MESNDLSEEGMWTIHAFFYELAQYEDVSLDRSEYEDYGVEPNFIHKKKGEHKQAIHLLTEFLEGEIEYVEGLETWAEEYDDHESYTGRWDDDEWENPVGK
jgi:hypothetical protein